MRPGGTIARAPNGLSIVAKKQWAEEISIRSLGYTKIRRWV